jgi:hypothetical protein
VGQRENPPRRDRDDTIHTLRLKSPVAFQYVRITTPRCYTDCSAVAVGMREQEARNSVDFPRKWN